LVLVLAILVASLLGANACYLSGVTILEAITGRGCENFFYQYMFLGHLALGFLLIAPLLAFVVAHFLRARRMPNRQAVRFGYALLATTLILVITGLALVRLGPFHLRTPALRSVAYWLHVASPLVAAWLYWLHRLAGAPIRWRVGLGYGIAVLGIGVSTVWLHRADPRDWRSTTDATADEARPYRPSLVRTASGDSIPARVLMNDQYCLDCHPEIHRDWADSVHRFSSFNNPVYLASVRETREVSMQRDGNVHRARWCAGCHDPVSLFSGAFDAPDFDDENDPTAHAGITCTVCHSVIQTGSTRGNGDYTIEEPLHYPFAYSENGLLRWVNRQLVKAKPSFHKRTFLKPLHKTTEFCSICHKVHIPEEVNDYKFLRGQNHYDTFLLSGVSGHGARSFYYPEKAETNCNGCHMPLKPSADFAAKRFDGTREWSIHDHLFPSANTGIAHLRGRPDVVKAHQQFLEGVMRVDLFGVRTGGTIDSPVVATLRPSVPTLRPNGKYLLEIVIRTLKMGHAFTQGTTDSNQVWLDVQVTSGDRRIGQSGGLDDRRRVDPWSHFVNAFTLDREGNRIARRNPQDVFVPLYDHQIPPGAAQTVHYALELPKDLTAPVTVTVRLQYRKFDTQLMEFVTENSDGSYVNDLPITTLAEDRITFPVEGTAHEVANPSLQVPDWERWNDYGIGLLLKGTAELRQAAEAFAKVEELGRYDGPLNLARVYYAEGRLDDAVVAIRRAASHGEPAAPTWTLQWLSGLVNRQQGHLEQAEQNFRSVLEDRTQEMIQRDFDFSLDYEVVNLLGETLFDRAKRYRGQTQAAERTALLEEAVGAFQKTLAIDSENVTAHYSLSLLYAQLGRQEEAATHAELHAKYKPDDNARDRAVQRARQRYPAANHAAEEVVIYSLHRAEKSEAEMQGDSTP